MLQTNERETSIKFYDFIIISPFAWIISQSVLHGNPFWLLIGYVFFLQYAYKRREYVNG